MAVTPESIRQDWMNLAHRRSEDWRRQFLVEAWYTRNESILKPEIYKGIPEDDWGKVTIYKNTVTATVDSLESLAIQPEPTIIVSMKNTTATSQQRAANAMERIGYAARYETNRYRSERWEDEVTHYCFSRGEAVTRYGFMDREERGEIVEQITAEVANQLPEEEVITDEDGNQLQIVEQGEFPGFVEVIDPLECVYVQGPGKKGVVKFIHRYWADYHDIIAAFPGVETKPEFSHIRAQSGLSNSHIQVWDYWDTEVRAIVIGNQMYYGPEKHNLSRLPIEVERIREQHVRHEFHELEDGTKVRHTNPVIRAVTPFAWPMIDDVTKASFAESLLATYLPEMVRSPIIHQGVSTGQGGMQASPYFQKVRYRDSVTGEERQEALPRYKFRGNKSSGGRPVWAAFDSEKFYPLTPTPIADHLQVFHQQRMFDLAQVGMDPEILTGRIRSEPSGLSVNQQLQLSAARTNRYVLGRNRLVSRTYTGLFKLLGDVWDRADAPLILHDLAQERDIEITQEMVRNIREIRFSIEKIFPRDHQADMQMNFQAQASGAMTLRQLVEELGREDPDQFIKQIAFERVALNDPRFLLSLAQEKAKDLGYDEQLAPQMQQEQQAEVQAAAEAEAQAEQEQQMAMGGGPEIPPGGMPPGEGPAGPGGGEQLPPELLAMLGQGGGPPQQGPPGPNGGGEEDEIAALIAMLEQGGGNRQR